MIQIRPQMDALSISMVMEQLVQLIHSTLLEVINLQINNSQFVSGEKGATAKFAIPLQLQLIL